MEVFEAAKKRRTIRRFQNKVVPFELLERCIEAARLAPSARNVQELEFVVVDSEGQVEKINRWVTFGGVVKEKGRIKGEEPRAFIIIISEEERSDSKNTSINAGIASHAIVLAAWELGLGSCIMGAIEREKIKEILRIPNDYSIELAIALGFPKESPVAEEAAGKELSYWIDDAGTLHVPKRPLGEVLHRNRF